MNQEISLAEYQQLIGHEVGLSNWFEINQDRINQFADVTEDHQFIHVDSNKAKDTPFGSTIAHGFLTLSLLVPMSVDAVPKIVGRKMGVNYGFDKVRFISPVKVGKRVRARFTLQSVEPKSASEFLTRTQVVVEIEGQEKPALIADWLGMSYF